MPIVIQHTPATLVGTLAAQAGIAQGQLRERGRLEQIQEIRTQQYLRQREQETVTLGRAQERQMAVQERALDRQLRQQESRMSRDMQLTQMMMAAQERGASEAAARVAQGEAFRLQSALASQRARVRPETPDVQAQRRELRQVVGKAEASGIYTPAQIKRMKIQADMGDTQAIRISLAKEERPTPSTQLERELKRQTKVYDDIAKAGAKKLQSELEGIQAEVSKDPNSAALITKRQEIVGRITQAEEFHAERKRRLLMGISIPKQEEMADRRAYRESLQADRLRKIEATKTAQMFRAERKRINDREKRNQSTIEKQRDRNYNHFRKLDPTMMSPEEYRTERDKFFRVDRQLREALGASQARQDAGITAATTLTTPQEPTQTPNEETAAMDALIQKHKGNLQAAKTEERGGLPPDFSDPELLQLIRESR